MACFEDAEESEVADLLKLTSDSSIDDPVGIGSVLELGLAGPSNSVSPCLTTAPVANEVLITRVDEDLESALKDSLNLGGKVVEPVS